MDSLSPESRALYEILMADTTELYESKFAAYKKARLDAVKQFVNDTRTQIKDLQTTVDSVPDKVEIEIDSVKAALGEDLAAVTSALSSETSALVSTLDRAIRSSSHPSVSVSLTANTWPLGEDASGPTGHRFASTHRGLVSASHSSPPDQELPQFDGDNPKLWQRRCDEYFLRWSTPEFLKISYSSSQFVGTAAANQAIHWTEIQPTCQVWTLLPSDLNGGFSFDNLWDPGGLISGNWHFQHLEASMSHTRSVSVALYGQQAIELFPRNEPGYACAPFEHSIDKVMEMFASPTITCELHYSTLVAESLLSVPYSSWCMRCVKIDLEGLWQRVSFLKLKPPWSNLADWHRQILEYNGVTCQYGSYKGAPSENAIHYVPASFIWYIAWLLVGLYCTHLLFGGSRNHIMEFTVQIMELQPTKIRWYPLPRAKPPNNYDKCNLLWKMQGISIASSPNLPVVTFKQPCQLQLLNAISSSEVVLLFSFRLLTENQSSLGSHDELHSSTMIWKLHDLLEMIELKPWPSWELFSCIIVVTSRFNDALHILTSSVLTLKGIYSKSSQYFEISGMFKSAPRYLEVGKYFECSQVGTQLCYVPVPKKISRFMSKHMGSASGDDTRPDQLPGITRHSVTFVEEDYFHSYLLDNLPTVVFL